MSNSNFNLKLDADAKMDEEIPEEQLLDFYSSIPRYYEGELHRIEGVFLETLKREVEFGGKKYLAEIQPARLEDSDGVDKDFYPTVREKLVEGVLRELVRDENYSSPDKEFDGVFDVNVIKDRLRLLGKDYSVAEIKDAVIICAASTITVSTENRDYIFILRPFEHLGFTTRTKGDTTKHPGNGKEEVFVFVKFKQWLK